MEKLISQIEVGVILKAVSFAAHKHRDQRRKDEDKSPYINHPIAPIASPEFFRQSSRR